MIELQPSGIVKVGTWHEERGYKAERMAPTNSQFDSIDNSLANKTFIVLLSVPVRRMLTFDLFPFIIAPICYRTNHMPVWWRVTNSLRETVSTRDMAWI